jgi:hypothetical protein
VTITENGRRRKITKREAVIKQLVNKSASSDARSLKILLDLMLNLEARGRSSAAPPPAVGPGDEQVLAQLKARLDGAIRDEIAAENDADFVPAPRFAPTLSSPASGGGLGRGREEGGVRGWR